MVDGEHLDRETSLITACDYAAGTRTFSREGDGGVEWEDQNVEQQVVAVDAETGEEVWRIDVSAESQPDVPQRRIWGPRHQQWTTPDGETATFDLATGETVTTKDAYEETVFCTQEQQTSMVRRFAETDGAPWHRDGDVVEAGNYMSLEPCSRDDLTAVEDLPSLAELRRIGREEAGTAVLPGPEGMVAYAVPDRASADSGS